MTFAQDIETEFDGERIDAVVIGFFPNTTANKYVPGNNRSGEVLVWGAARPLLDYEYNSIFGGPACHPVYVYSRTRVMIVTCYDGSTETMMIPRDPAAGEMPEYAGGI